MSPVKVLKIIIVICMVVILAAQMRDYIKNKEPSTPRERVIFAVIGFIVNFFDTLGIGSFAPTLALYHLTHTVDDRDIPGTLNVGVAFVVFLEAILFINAVEVDEVTLISTQIIAIIGAYLGARANEKINVNGLRLVMGIGLGVAAFLLIGSKIGFLPSGGEEMGAYGIKLVLINISAFIFGFVLPLGVGHYAPMLAIVSLLGMAPIAAFPIMMTMGGLSTMTGAFRFFKNGLLHRRAAFAQTVFGSVGVLVAFYIVKSLPLGVLQWLVIIVVTYTSVTMIRQGLLSRSEKQEVPAAVESEK